jgi:hypothetical protein
VFKRNFASRRSDFMSVVITYMSDSISIIATDTRVSYGKNANWGVSDNNEKLII